MFESRGIVVTGATSQEPSERSSLEPPWWRERPTGARSRAPLSRDAIVDAAVRIVDAEGVDALTIRRLGEELGTGAATLYWHISGKEELGELVYDRIMGDVEVPEPDPEHWGEQIKTFARSAYAVLRSHRDAVRLSLGRVPVGPNMLRVMEWHLGLLRAAGIPDGPAGYFGDIFGRFLDASVLEETSAPHTRPGTDDEAADVGAQYLEMVREHFRTLPPDQFPNLVALAGSGLFEGSAEERFEFGLDVLVRGLAAYAR
jgi:AcrR family transcriptional regulator